MSQKHDCEELGQRYPGQDWFHIWVKSTAQGWYVCHCCGAAAVCPACLPGRLRMPGYNWEAPEGVSLIQCRRHGAGIRGPSNW